jgi:hypothetical protein
MPDEQPVTFQNKRLSYLPDVSLKATKRNSLNQVASGGSSYGLVLIGFILTQSCAFKWLLGTDKRVTSVLAEVKTINVCRMAMAYLPWTSRESYIILLFALSNLAPSISRLWEDA